MVEKDTSAIGFKVENSQFQNDDIDYGSDDDWKPPTPTPMHDLAPKEVVAEAGDDSPHPGIAIADTVNNRIQYIPDNAREPPLCYGTKGEGKGQFREPEDVAYHDNFSDWDAEKSQRCKDFRATGQNVPSYYLGLTSRMQVYDTMLENGRVGDFSIIETNQPNHWKMIHVTPASYKAADVEETVIKVRDNGFVVQGDTRSDGVPKTYKNLHSLVVDGQKWLHLKVKAETRHYCKIAVCDTGNHRVQVLGFIAPTFDKRSDTLLTLFPAKFVVLSILGSGSKARGGGKCHLSYPSSCAYNSHGDLVVCDAGHWRVCIFAPDGEMVHSIGSRIELQDGPLGRPRVANFGRDLVGNESVLVGYSKGLVYNYTVPPPVIKGDVGHLPREAALNAFSFLDFRGAAQAAVCCKLFHNIVSKKKKRKEKKRKSSSKLAPPVFC